MTHTTWCYEEHMNLLSYSNHNADYSMQQEFTLNMQILPTEQNKYAHKGSTGNENCCISSVGPYRRDSF